MLAPPPPQRGELSGSAHGPHASYRIQAIDMIGVRRARERVCAVYRVSLLLRVREGSTEAEAEAQVGRVGSGRERYVIATHSVAACLVTVVSSLLPAALREGSTE
jgi:hypothetical protein